MRLRPPRISYVTNGLADHRLEDALALLADSGYAGVGLTLDHHHLDPFAPDLGPRVDALARRLDDLGLAVVVETGARFLLDPRRKHQPTLLSAEGAERRVDLLRRALAIAEALGAEAVSLWSGSAEPGADPAVAWRRLVERTSAVVAEAERRGVPLGFEPEPGMLVERIADIERLREELGRPAALGVTLDIGHCICGEDADPAACVARVGPSLVNVHVEDMRRGVHEHLDFGQGELDLPPVFVALDEAGYAGLVSVELSRHSHVAHESVPRAIATLREAALTVPV